MSPEKRITKWLCEYPSLRTDARKIADGPYGDRDLKDWVHGMLYKMHHGSYAMRFLGLSPNYPAVLGAQVTESQLCTADWGTIVKDVLNAP